MRDVLFHLPHDVILEIDSLTGTLHPTGAGSGMSLDDLNSFTIDIEQGSIALSTAALSTLMNEWVFGYDGAPVGGFEFRTEDGRLVQKGKLHKIIDVGFEIEAIPELTPTGSIRIHPEKMKVLGFIGGGFLKRIGLELDDLLDATRAHGVRVEGNDIILDPMAILPPPRMRGRIRSIRVEPGRLVQIFEQDPADSATHSSMPEAPTAGGAGTDAGFMHFTGGSLAFGRLQMNDVILHVIDDDPADPFDFSIVEYQRQLIAGYSKTRPDLGLDVHMPDLADVRRTESAAPRRRN